MISPADMVQTNAGMLPRHELDVRTFISEENGNAIVTACEWRYRGAIVRRDVWVNLKRGLATAIEGSL